MESDSALISAPRGVGRGRLSQFWAFTPIGRAGRVLVLTIVVAVMIVDLVILLAGASTEPLAATVAQFALTAVFALFVWRPPTAALVLQVSALMAVSLNMGEEPLLAAAIGTGLVVATCSVILSVLYLAGFVALLGLGISSQSPENALSWAVAFVVTAGVALIVGYILRRLTQRTVLLADELAERQRQLEQAVRIERERLADELHDFIAHELTIISMHASVLEHTEDPETQAEAREAISGSARQALADIRRVLEVTQAARAAEEAEEDGVVERRRLVATVTDVERELAAAGFAVQSDGVYTVAARMSRTMEVALAQFVRESGTNVLKHAEPRSGVVLSFSLEREVVVFRMTNAVRGSKPSLEIPSGGYGTVRMRERAAVLGGSFEAGVHDSQWSVEVRLPLR